MIYVFRKEELYTTTNTKLLKKRKNYIVVDATGTKYVEKGAHKVKWQGLSEFVLRCPDLSGWDEIPQPLVAELKRA